MEPSSQAPHFAAPNPDPFKRTVEQAVREYRSAGCNRHIAREELLTALKNLVETVEADAGKPCTVKAIFELVFDYDIYKNE